MRLQHRRFMKLLTGALTVAVCLVPLRARAAAPSACTDTFERAQVLRKQDKLVLARDQLRACAQSSCPRLIVNDCAQWLDEVQGSIPTVVPVATDEAGSNLADIRLLLDGTALPETLRGRAIDVDPGTHQFTFERRDLPSVTTSVLVAIGEKNKRVAVVMRPAGAAVAEVPHVTSTKANASSMSPVGITGLVAAAAGVVGLGVGGAFGIEAINQQDAAHCPGNRCPPGSSPQDLSDAKTDGNVSTVFFVAGGALAAGGVTLWLLAPRRADVPSAAAVAGSSLVWLRVAPLSLGKGGGGGVVSGVW